MPSSDGASGEEDEEVKEQRGEWVGGDGWGDETTGRRGREIGAERQRQEPRELASPSANFITELVVFAQIISIYSTQAGNLFASECMREWNLPPRSRLARAGHVCARLYVRVCLTVCLCSVCRSGIERMEWVREMGSCTRRDRVNASSALAFSAGKRKVTRTRFHVKSVRYPRAAGRESFARLHKTGKHTKQLEH